MNIERTLHSLIWGISWHFRLFTDVPPLQLQGAMRSTAAHHRGWWWFIVMSPHHQSFPLTCLPQDKCEPFKWSGNRSSAVLTSRNIYTISGDRLSFFLSFLLSVRTDISSLRLCWRTKSVPGKRLIGSRKLTSRFPEIDFPVPRNWLPGSRGITSWFLGNRFAVWCLHAFIMLHKHKKGSSQKTFHKTFFTTWRPILFHSGYRKALEW